MGTMARTSECSASHKLGEECLFRYSANDVLALEIAAAGTQYSAQNATTGSQAAFETLLQGDLWMIFRNILTNVLHWDFVSRYIPAYMTVR